MRKTFPGYYKPSEAEFKKLWNKCLFVLDANVLLNLYRYSSETRKKLVEILQRLETRLWVPHQAALEYQRNRLDVISAQRQAYDQIELLLGDTHKRLETQLNSYRRHPLINVDALLRSVASAFKSQSKMLAKAREKHPDLLGEDPVRETLTKLLDGKVGPPYSEAKLKEIFRDGAERYRKSIPPGYRDAKSKEGERAFGDLVLWLQVIDKAEKDKTPIVIVTDDVKEDWWWRHEGKIVGPHPELVAEIRERADVDFYMYVSDQFMKYARQFLKEEVDQGAIDEVREVRAQESARRLEIERFVKAQELRLVGLEDERRHLEMTAGQIEADVASLSSQIGELRSVAAEGNDSTSLQERMAALAERKEQMLARSSLLRHKRHEIEFQMDRARAQRNRLAHQGLSQDETRSTFQMRDLLGRPKTSPSQ